MARTAILAIGGVVALAGLGFQAPRAQELPIAPFDEVKSWGPATPGVMEWEPAGADIDATGNVYFLRRSDPAIWVMEPSGTVVRSFGNTLFVWAHGLHVDRQGNIWATDCALGPPESTQLRLQPNNPAALKAGRGHQVYKFSPEGNLLMTLGKAGQPGAGVDQFHCPTDVVTARDGSIFVSDGHGGGDPNARILKFTKEGSFIKTWGRKGKGPGEFTGPHTVAFDSGGRLFVGDRVGDDGRIQIFDQEGRFLQEYRNWGRPSGIAITSDDTLYVCCGDQQIYVGSAKTGVVTGVIKNIWAEGIAADDRGNVYAGEVIPKVWRKFTRRP